MATSPATPHSPNEDFTGALPHAAVLLDGAGLSGARSTCIHGVAWYTRRLGGTLLNLLAAQDDRPLTEILAEAITDVGNAHQATCDITDPSSPSATVIILRLSGDQADYLVLADSVLVLDQADGQPVVISDDREAIVGKHYRAAMDATPNDTPEHDEARKQYVEALRAHRNQPGGFWVAADIPQAATEAITGSHPIHNLAAAALLSDGASRITDRFALADWPEVLTILNQHGPAEVIHRVRTAEASDPQGKTWPRGKTFDDATITYCTQLAETR